jgi:HD superfamily phosphohydrolase/tRNA A-37 threonylcarbamoyl transferase component Bud32
MVIRRKYQIVRKVGEGGMGVVYEARDLILDNRCALKVMRPGLASDTALAERFRREAAAALALKHPNVVHVETIDRDDDDRLFIVMEFVEGTSLKDVIEKEGPQPPSRVCSVAKQVACALDAAHKLGIVHRDIKTANIVLTGTPEREGAKVLDFGIAKVGDTRTDRAGVTPPGQIIGTPEYMSPERAMGMGGDEIDGRSDIYSLGVVMYEMLSGLLPFRARTAPELLRSHISDQPTPIQQARPGLHIPVAIAAVVMKCLKKDPNERPASAHALAEEIAEAERVAEALAATVIVTPLPGPKRIESDDLAKRVDSFVKWLFSRHETIVPRDSKVINDSLLGNQFFTKPEVAVIDSPLLQRLKRIKQTGLAYQVFPSATHTRFEHCLGACTIAERSFKAVQDRFSVEFRGKPLPATDGRLDGDLAHLRMAALLHDVGHGLCSHSSEQIYEALTDLQEFKRNPAFAKNSPGEILSHLIIKSPTFSDWFNTHVVGKCHAELDLHVIAEMVLGKHPDIEKYFLSQIVSSPYDADKLDYIARDSYYCGLALTVDLARFYSMISTASEHGYNLLVLRNYVPLEQILFSKMTLFGAVYHHPKVKCLDAMLRSLIRHIVDNPDQCPVSVRGRNITFGEATEYLYLTDEEFFNQLDGFGDGFTRKMLDRFRRRDLFVRCLEISRRTIGRQSWEDFYRKGLIDLSDNPAKLRDAESEIHKRLPGEVRRCCNVGEVLVSIPAPPKIKGDFAYIQTIPRGPVESIERFFPVEQWTEAYAHNKWRGFVYGPREHAGPVRDAAISFLRENLSVEIDRTRLDLGCHLH